MTAVAYERLLLLRFGGHAIMSLFGTKWPNGFGMSEYRQLGTTYTPSPHYANFNSQSTLCTLANQARTIIDHFCHFCYFLCHSLCFSISDCHSIHSDSGHCATVVSCHRINRRLIYLIQLSPINNLKPVCEHISILKGRSFLPEHAMSLK